MKRVEPSTGKLAQQWYVISTFNCNEYSSGIGGRLLASAKMCRLIPRLE